MHILEKLKMKDQELLKNYTVTQVALSKYHKLTNMINVVFRAGEKSVLTKTKITYTASEAMIADDDRFEEALSPGHEYHDPKCRLFTRIVNDDIIEEEDA